MPRTREALPSLLIVLGLLAPLHQGAAQTPTELAAFHRSGQTFLTWRELPGPGNEYYRVYRHTQPITPGNLGSATRVAQVPDSSAMYMTERWMTDYGMTPVQRNFIINDLGPELQDTQGLFVFTVHPGEEGVAYYAVTSLAQGVENTTVIPGQNALTTGVQESVADPLPVMVWRSANGRAMVFTQFMDFRNWNPTMDGYASNYFVSLPDGYDAGTAYPLYLHIEGYGTRYVDAFVDHANGTGYGWPAIQIWGDDPHQSWYYGYAKDHSWGDDWPQYVWSELPSQPETGSISNFTEQRLLRAIHDVMRDPRFNVDENRIYAYGHSMGGSGALALGMRYPNVFAAVYCSEPMTNFLESAEFFYDVVPKWGLPFYALPIVNEGPYASHLTQYDGTNVWDWMNHRGNMVNRWRDDMAYIVTYHGTQDDVINWHTQGEPWCDIMDGRTQGWVGAALPIDHTWWGFLDTPNFTFGDFSFRRDRSFPAFSNCSFNIVVPDSLAYYNLGIEWSCPWNDFAGDVVDTPDRWEVTLRVYDPGLPGLETVADQGTVDVTTRRTRQFLPPPGTQCYWRNLQLSGNEVVQSGQTTPSDTGIVTIRGVIVTRAGNRLVIGTGTPADDGDGAPPPLRLSCRPNPSRSRVEINYELPQATHVTISVHDPGGRRISVVSRGWQDAGPHHAVWEGVDSCGEPVAPGVYLCRMETPQGVSVRPFVVLR